MDDLDRRLAALGDTLLAEPRPVPELRQRAQRIRRRRQARRVTGALAAAALGLALWSVVDGLGTRRVEFPPVDEGRTEPEPAAEWPVARVPEPFSEWPLGLVVGHEQGVVLVPLDAPDQAILLESDPGYERVLWAFPDQRGGLVFQHAVTPPPWPPGAVLWLRAGATRPELLIPPEAPWKPWHFWRAGILPIGMATTTHGRALFVYAVEDEPRSETRIMVADLDAAGALRELATVEGGIISPEFGPYAVAGGAVVALTDEVEGCLTLLRLLRVDDGAPLPGTSDCRPRGFPRLSHDGRSLGVLEYSLDVSLYRVTVTVVDLQTGATVQEATVEIDLDSGLLPGLISSPGGWLVAIQTWREALFLDLDGGERFRVDRALLPHDISPFHISAGYFTGAVAGFPYYHPFDLPPGASLGSGSGERPCQPFAGELAVQDLPAAVAQTRQALFDLAAACDYEGLASLAREHATKVFFSGIRDLDFGARGAVGGVVIVGDDDRQWSWGVRPDLATEEDVVRSWIADGRSGPQGYGIRSREPLATLAALLGTTPVYVEDAIDLPLSHPQPEGRMWVWPAVYVEPNGDPDDLALWEEHRDYRIGIASDGTWRFFMAGDFGFDPAREVQPQMER
jgi:hypothetical protein